MLQGHAQAVRRLKCSPHSEVLHMRCSYAAVLTIVLLQGLIGSVSYDMSFCLWNFQDEDALIQRAAHHTEFVVGLDFNLFHPTQVPYSVLQPSLYNSDLCALLL